MRLPPFQGYHDVVGLDVTRQQLAGMHLDQGLAYRALSPALLTGADAAARLSRWTGRPLGLQPYIFANAPARYAQIAVSIYDAYTGLHLL